MDCVCDDIVLTIMSFLEKHDLLCLAGTNRAMNRVALSASSPLWDFVFVHTKHMVMPRGVYGKIQHVLFDSECCPYNHDENITDILSRNYPRIKSIDFSYCWWLRDLDIHRMRKHIPYATKITTTMTNTHTLCDAVEIRASYTAVGRTPIPTPTRCRSMYIDGTPIIDVSVLSYCVCLQTLVIADTKISDISPLTKCTNLIHLDISATHVTDITCIVHIQTLRILNVSHTYVADIQCVCVLGLHELYAQSTYISAVPACTSLEILDVGNTNVCNLRALVACVNLRRLLIGGTRVDDLLSIAQLPIVYLDVSRLCVDAHQLHYFRNLSSMCVFHTIINSTLIPPNIKLGDPHEMIHYTKGIAYIHGNRAS